MMRLKTMLNGEYVDSLKWDLEWTLGQFDRALQERYGTGRGYVYTVVKRGQANANLHSVDALCNLVAERLIELGKPVPENLWCKLLVQEWVEVEDKDRQSAQGEHS